MITSQQQEPAVNHTCTQTLDAIQVNEPGEQEGCVAVEEEPLDISSLNTDGNNTDLGFDISNVSVVSLMDISVSDLIIPEVTVTSTSSDGLIAVKSTEPAPSQNVCQPEIAPNTTDAIIPSHEATEQFSDRDSFLVECELNSRDGANGSAASTSKQARDTCVAITPITTAGARVHFLLFVICHNV